MSGKALLVVGSPRNKGSNSHFIGKYLIEKISEKGWSVDEEFVYQAVRNQDIMTKILKKLDDSDLVILVFPLYVDSLPSQMIKFLENVNEQRKGKGGPKPRLIAICQSGFPESNHCDFAVRICQFFARDSGFGWAGGLSIGGGSAVHAVDLNELGGMGRNLRRALELTATSLVNGGNVPAEAKELTNKGVLAPWLLRLIVNRGWKKQCRANGVDIRAILND